MPEKKKKRIHRLCPCPACDIEKMESWLSHMAAEGWLLEKDGFFAGFAAFEQAQPQKLRYRLEATHKELSFWSDEQEPPEEALELSAAEGWEYLARREGFFIYRSADPAAPELNTDPAVQALALKKVRGRIWNNIAYWAVWAVILPLLRLEVGPLQILTEIGTLFGLCGLGLIIWWWCARFRDLFYLRRLRKSLLQKGGLDHGKPWAPRALAYRVGRILRPTLIALWCLLLLGGYMQDITGARELPLAEFAGEVPFATMADFGPAESYSLNDWGFSNTVEQGGDWLAPRIIHWRELAEISGSSGGLDADYYETAAPWVARGLAKEFQRMDRRRAGKDYKELDLPELGLDYAAGYMNNLHFSTVVLQKGEKILHASFYQTGENRIPLESWVRLLAESLE